MEKEQNLINNENSFDTSNVKIYKENGSVIRVKREFSYGGTNILEQVICLLLDLMEKENKQETQISSN